MAVGTDPMISLSLLYKDDPFYSLCLSDLLTAPQHVKNKFLREQKELTVALRKLEKQKLSRLRQLDEEKKQFHLLMIKKLSPRVTISRVPSTATKRNNRQASSSVLVSSLASDKNSWKSLDQCWRPSGTGAKGGTQSPFCRHRHWAFPATCIQLKLLHWHFAKNEWVLNHSLGTTKRFTITGLDIKSDAKLSTGFFLATKGEFPATRALKFHKVSFERILNLRLKLNRK